MNALRGMKVNTEKTKNRLRHFFFIWCLKTGFNDNSDAFKYLITKPSLSQHDHYALPIQHK